ncbi:MAG: GatB/YqeY domain-containing protein [Ezakiella sp.]|nr:GatB/YqeY domain-containing protein [Ezakiella sp.]MDD7761210.1 GatB/YqeY domain-containing protein [Bacillota bacterium]MDY3946832.1 GatB/YqeY domain-containing protein [Ezakiella sp.]
MLLKDQLMNDLKTSMKEKDALRKNTITMLRARIKQFEVDNRVEADDEKILQLVQKELKERTDTIDSLKDTGRDDLIETAKEESKILEAYLPKQLEDSELEKIVDNAIKVLSASSMKDMGSVMNKVKDEVGSSATPKRISEVVKAKLSSL